MDQRGNTVLSKNVQEGCRKQRFLMGHRTALTMGLVLVAQTAKHELMRSTRHCELLIN